MSFNQWPRTVAITVEKKCFIKKFNKFFDNLLNPNYHNATLGTLLIAFIKLLNTKKNTNHANK